MATRCGVVWDPVTKETGQVKVRIVRASEPAGFTQVPNAALRDERLSYKARGIHANLLSNSDEGWIESADTLADKSPDGRHAVRTGLQELVKHGYIEYRKSQGSDGHWSTEMIVYTSPKSGNPTSARPAASPLSAQVAPGSGNPTSVRGQKTRRRADQQKRESPQLAPESGYPTAGKPDAKQNTKQNTRQNTRERSAPPSERHDGLSEIPDNFDPTDAMLRWANATFGERIDVNFETAQFASHYRSTGARRKSWPDAWQKWLRDSDRRITERGPSQRASPGAVVPIDRRQQATNDLFDRAMVRAEAREGTTS